MTAPATSADIEALRRDLATYRAENTRILQMLEGIAFPKETQAERAAALGITTRALRARLQRARAAARISYV